MTMKELRKIFILIPVFIFFSCTIIFNVYTYKLTIIEPSLEGKYVYITFYKNYSIDPVTNLLNGEIAGRARILITSGSGTSYISSSYNSQNALWLNNGTYFWFAFADMNGNASSTMYRPDAGDKYSMIIQENIDRSITYIMSGKITNTF